MNPGPKVLSLLSLQSHYGLPEGQGPPLTLRSSQVLNNKQLKGSKVRSSSAGKPQDEKQRAALSVPLECLHVRAIVFTSGHLEPLIQRRLLRPLPHQLHG